MQYLIDKQPVLGGTDAADDKPGDSGLPLAPQPESELEVPGFAQQAARPIGRVVRGRLARPNAIVMALPVAPEEPERRDGSGDHRDGVRLGSRRSDRERGREPERRYHRAPH